DKPVGCRGHLDRWFARCHIDETVRNAAGRQMHAAFVAWRGGIAGHELGVHGTEVDVGIDGLRVVLPRNCIELDAERVERFSGSRLVVIEAGPRNGTYPCKSATGRLLQSCRWLQCC